MLDGSFERRRTSDDKPIHQVGYGQLWIWWQTNCFRWALGQADDPLR